MTAQALRHDASVTTGQLFAVCVATYAACIAVIWGYYCLFSGFPYETGLIVPSDQNPGFGGLFYVDPLRTFTSVFYHLSYLIGLAAGQAGSYLPYQLVYAALWLARCLLTFAIVKAIMPDRPALAAIAGLLVALLANDASLNWVGQLNQFGFIFWMLCGFLAYVHAQKVSSRLAALALSVLGAFFIYLCLWSYESPLPVCMAFPIFVAMVLRPLGPRRFPVTTFIFLVPSVVFAVLNVRRYLGSAGGASYQTGVLRSDLSLTAIAGDMGYHFRNALAFWTWPNSPWQQDLTGSYYLVFAVIALAIVVLAPLIVLADRKAGPLPASRAFMFILASVGMLFASYLVAVAIAGNRSMWRTEFLASFATATLGAMLVYLVVRAIPTTWIRTAVLAGILLAVGFFSALNGVNSGARNRALWDRYRTILASIVGQFPQVADGTLMVLRNVPPDETLFGHNMWFDLALRTAYPHKMVAGLYQLNSGAIAPGANISLRSGAAELAPDGFPTVFHSNSSSKINHIVVFDLDPSSWRARLVSGPGASVGEGAQPIADYRPCAAAAGAIPDTLGYNRYAPLEAVGDSCRQGLKQ